MDEAAVGGGGTYFVGGNGRYFQKLCGKPISVGLRPRRLSRLKANPAFNIPV